MTPKQRQLGIFHAPLKSKDNATQTEGCRHTQPDICAKNRMPKKCAFVNQDGMCYAPPSSWPKQFERLKAESLKAKKPK